MFAFLKHQFITSSMQSLLEGSILGLLALVIYLFTINEETRIYALPILVISLVLILAIYFFDVHIAHKKTDIHQKRTFQILIFACVSAILLWVGTTGWFLSPFFYLLYLVAVSLAFLFNTSATFSFILVLVAILIPQIGGVNTNINIFSLLSLVFIIPLSYFLRKEYITRIEKEKKILVLEGEHKALESNVDKMLANKITNLGAKMREPINDIRQIALFAEKNGAPRDEKDFSKIIISTSRAFDMLNAFEEEATGRKLARTPKSS
jgi:hypothetical protein